MKEIMRGVDELIGQEVLEARLKSPEPLIVKLGLDPTAADIHLGHTVVINKLRLFQQMGHRVVFLIGDFTAKIGDPSGRNAMRQILTEDQIKANAQTYAEQVFKILDSEKTEIVYNSTWMKDKSAQDILELSALQTVARMLERDDFEKRYKSGQPIGIHEFIYPLLQGYDSVALKADIELGGKDQKFNLLMGRELQKHWNMPAQAVLMMPLLVGLDGVKKMSKSANNYIGVNDSPQDMFGKVMSVPDELLWHYYDLLSFEPVEVIGQYREEVDAGSNPRDKKVLLALELVARFHSKEAAEMAHNDFIKRFVKRGVPEDLELQYLEVQGGALPIAYILKGVKLVSSTSEAIRMIKQGAVRIDGEQIFDTKLELKQKSCHVYQVGRRKAAKVCLK